MFDKLLTIYFLIYFIISIIKCWPHILKFYKSNNIVNNNGQQTVYSYNACKAVVPSKPKGLKKIEKNKHAKNYIKDVKKAKLSEYIFEKYVNNYEINSIISFIGLISGYSKLTLPATLIGIISVILPLTTPVLNKYKTKKLNQAKKENKQVALSNHDKEIMNEYLKGLYK